MGKNVGQNLQSKSHSKNRSNWVMQLQKEGPSLKLYFDVCLCERCFFQFLSGHYSVGKDFTFPKGREHNMPYSSCSLSLANFCPLGIHQILFPSTVILFRSFRCPSFLREPVPLGIYEWTMNIIEQAELCRNAELKLLQIMFDLYECISTNLKRFVEKQQFLNKTSYS